MRRPLVQVSLDLRGVVDGVLDSDQTRVLGREVVAEDVLDDEGLQEGGQDNVTPEDRLAGGEAVLGHPLLQLLEEGREDLGLELGQDLLLLLRVLLLQQRCEAGSEVLEVGDEHVGLQALQVVLAVEAELLGEVSGQGDGLLHLHAVDLQHGQLAERRGGLELLPLLLGDAVVHVVDLGVGEKDAQVLGAAADREVGELVAGHGGGGLRGHTGSTWASVGGGRRVVGRLRAPG